MVPMVVLAASQRSAAFDAVRSAGDVGIALARPAADSAAARRRQSRDITACLWIAAIHVHETRPRSGPAAHSGRNAGQIPYPSVTNCGALVLPPGPPLSRAGRDIAGRIAMGEPGYSRPFRPRGPRFDGWLYLATIYV
jgi:hypothetical protein